jgi:glycosyltransferase involved in cell wall biosynthesis
VDFFGVLKNFFLKTFGCQQNISDSQRIETILRNLNFQKTEKESDADLVILNSCAVKQHAEDRIFGLLEKLQKLRCGRLKLIGITGCTVRVTSGRNFGAKKDPLLRRAKFVDFVFRIEDAPRLGEILNLQNGGVSRISNKKLRNGNSYSENNSDKLTAQLTARLTGKENSKFQNRGEIPNRVRDDKVGVRDNKFSPRGDSDLIKLGSVSNFQKKIWFGFAGRFSEEKNLEKLVATFFELQKIRDDFILILAGGDSISRQKLIQKITPEIRGKIFLPGFLRGEKLRDFFCALDFFLLFSKFESFSIAALEALFYGKPVLCAPVGVLPEIIRSGENGFFLDLKKSPAEIAAEIDTILREKNWREMEFFARKSVQKFSAKNFANRVREIFA